MIRLEGNRVALVSEIPAMAREWRNCYQIRRWCREYTEISLTKHQYYLDRIEKDPTIRMFGIQEVEEGYPIGVCGLTSISVVNQSAEFSLYIAPPAQEEGYGKEALETLCSHGFHAFNLNRIWGEVFDGNPAMGMFERLGFKIEGRLRKSYFRDGAFIDSHLIALLREDSCLSRHFSALSSP